MSRYAEGFEMYDRYPSSPNVGLQSTGFNEYQDSSEGATQSESIGDGAFHYRYRRTSLHRNVNMRQQVGARSDNWEDRQDWIDTAATLSRQPLQEHVDHIVQKIEGDVLLTANTQQSEQLRREALRDMPQGLTMKRLVKRKLLKNLDRRERNSRSIGCFRQFIYKMSIMKTKFILWLQSIFYTIELWYTPLKNIEGQFGSAISTFFRFYRWLFLLNIVTLVTCLFFLIIPQILHTYYPDVIGGNENNNETEEVDANLQRELRINDATFYFEDLFTGDGSLRSTILFYGFYTNSTIQISNGLDYKMPHAYFYTMLAIYLMNFIVLSISAATSYRRNFIETKGGLKNEFAHKIFTGWDFGIATKEAARLKSSGIWNELKELLNEWNKDVSHKSCTERFCALLLQIVVNLVVLGLLAAIGYGLWSLFDQDRTNVHYGIITAFVMNFIVFVVPFVLTLISRFESYKTPRTAFYVTLARTFLLELAIIGILVAYWLRHATHEESWETMLGQEIYRLIIFDFIFTIFFYVLTEVVHKLVSLKFDVMPPEFNIARYALQLSYNQTLFWIGLYFAPLLSLVVVIKLFITWYVFTWGMLKLCSPSRKSWKAAQMYTWFFIMTFISLMLVMVTLAYTIVSVKTSMFGPFSHLEYAYDILKNEILNLKDGHVFWSALIYITKPGAVSLILLSMCMVVYYLRAKALAQQGLVDVLRSMLITEARDKEFLLQRISQITKGQWQYNLTDNGLDPCITSPSNYSIMSQRIQDYTDSNLDAISSEMLLPSSSDPILPLDDSAMSLDNRFKKYE